MKSNRDGVGARITSFSQGLKQEYEVQSGSILSHNDFRIHNGLGKVKNIDSVETYGGPVELIKFYMTFVLMKM